MNVEDCLRHSEAFNGRRPLRLLALDGGGVRGLSSLVILKHLMKRLNPSDPPKPCEYFNLIGGTSTGGLIAIMLGRLRMDVDSCISAYQNLSGLVFQPSRPKMNLFGKVRDVWKVEGAFDSEKLATEIRKMVEKCGEPAEAKLMESEPQCHVFVCAIRKEITTPVRFRNYTTATQVEEVSCTIWQAGRATSAASLFFSPIKIGNQWFTDGATGFNNPINEVMDEARRIWPDTQTRIERVVSIGTGKPALRAFGIHLKALAETMIRISTDTETTANRFITGAQCQGLGGIYFRFNVSQGLEDVALESHEESGKIEAATNSYLNDFDVVQTVTAFAACSPSSLAPTQPDIYLKSLPTYDVLGELAQIAKPVGNTFQWIWTSEEWLESTRSGVLLIVGKPGCGKSVLLAYIQQSYPSRSAYFACKENEDVRRTPEMILSSLLNQILTSQPVLFRSALHRGPSAQDWNYRELLACFDAVINSPHYNGTICMIDALDECHLNSRKQFLRDLRLIFGRASRNTNAGFPRLVISTRNYPDIIVLKSTIIDLDSCSAMREDVREFVENKVSRLVEERPDYEPLRHFIKSRLEDRIGTMYRLVELLIHELWNTSDSTYKSLKQMLASVPDDISSVYDRIWGRIPLADQERARQILSWLLCSLRPLTCPEMAYAIALQLTYPNTKTTPDRLDTSKDISGDLRRLFGPLVRIHSTIELSHQTVKDHFLQRSSNRYPSRYARNAIREDQGHAVIAMTCLRHLVSDEVQTSLKGREYRQPSEFLEYSLRFMSQHVALSRADGSEIEGLVVDLFESETWSRVSFQHPTSYSNDSSTAWPEPLIDNAVSFSCRYDLPALLLKLIDNGYIWKQNVFGRWGRQRCSIAFCAMLSQILLSGSERCIPVLLRSFEGTGVRTLLKCKDVLEQAVLVGSMVLSFDDEHEEDEEEEDEEENEGTAELSWEEEEEDLPGMTNASCQDRLQESKGSGISPQVLNKMLAAFRTLYPIPIVNADKEMTSDWPARSIYNTGLLYCLFIEISSPETTDLLRQDSEALLACVKNGKMHASELLIREGAGLLSRDKDGMTPLHWAAKIGHTGLVNLILNQKVIDVNDRTHAGLTPLHCACSEEELTQYNNHMYLKTRPESISRAEVISLLQDSGALTRSRDLRGNTPFQTLARVYVPEWKEIPKDSELNWREQDLNSCVQKLLTTVADVVEWDSFGTTPLHTATFLWPVSAITQILEHLRIWSISPTLVNNFGNTPMHLAAVRGFDEPEAVLKLLAESGADPWVKNIYGEDPGTIASKFGRTRVAEEYVKACTISREKMRTKHNRDAYNAWQKSNQSIGQHAGHGKNHIQGQSDMQGFFRPPMARLFSDENLQTYPYTGSAPNGVSTVIHTHDGSKWRAINYKGFNHQRFSLNIDPFGGVGLVTIRRPIPPSMVETLLLLKNADQERYNSIMHESYFSSPLQRRTSSGLEEQQYESESDADQSQDDYDYDHDPDYDDYDVYDCDYDYHEGMKRNVERYLEFGLFTVKEGVVLSLAWVVIFLCMFYCGAGNDQLLQPPTGGFVRPIVDAHTHDFKVESCLVRRHISGRIEYGTEDSCSSGWLFGFLASCSRGSRSFEKKCGTLRPERAFA